MASHNVTFVNVIGALDHVVFNQNRNAVFILSVVLLVKRNALILYSYVRRTFMFLLLVSFTDI